MAISFLTNPSALTAVRILNATTEKSARSMERLASGRRLNHAADDAAGTAISAGLECKIRSASMATKTVQDALSVTQVAEGGMNEITNMIIRLRELAIQASSDTVSDEERGYYNFEAVDLKEEIERMATTTKYLGINLISGGDTNLVFQVGVENTEFDKVTYQATGMDLRASALGIDGIEYTDKDKASEAITTLDSALTVVNSARAQLGALQGRFTPIVNYLESFQQSLSEANSRLRDTDVARESAEYMALQVRERLAISILAQANELPAKAFRLLE